ncbi:hypothetical protein CEXT_50671 [Caerostris extrusa]|uniref:Uncharacterized protein n=1 Tax=Caerostris extrusa TaxID=172846 RepID=A0AAV4UNI7_CAEEX|nr:hypothetical protein CEXT_50671 [Caerostris extrusa]
MLECVTAFTSDILFKRELSLCIHTFHSRPMTDSEQNSILHLAVTPSIDRASVNVYNRKFQQTNIRRAYIMSYFNMTDFFHVGFLNID